MSRLNEYKQLLDEYDAAELTAGALEDIAALRMQAIRSGFEKNRTFFEGIGALYATLRSVATKEGGEKKLGKGKRHLYVAITSNKRFYGNLMREVIAALSRALASAPETSALIIGRIGWQYFEQTNALKKARQFILVDDTPTRKEFEELMLHLDGFDRVFVLYPQFINPFRQDVGITDITQSPGERITQQESATQTPKGVGVGAPPAGAPEGVGTYIFEPEVDAILAFFDAQVKRVLFQGVLLEAELARTAARFLRMEEAQEHAHDLVVATRSRVRREMSAVSNTELLETFAGFTKWKQL